MAKTCAHCGDPVESFIFKTMELAPTYCEKCEPMREMLYKQEQETEKRKAMFEHSKIPEAYLTGALKEYLLSYKNQRKASDTLTSDSINQTNKSFYLFGPNGTGKTMICVDFIKKLVVVEGKDVVMVNFSDYVSEEMAYTTDSTRRLACKYKAAQVLYIDDLGNHPITNSLLNLLYTVINKRYTEKKQTIFSSNFDPIALGKHLTNLSKNAENSSLCKSIVDRIIHMAEPLPVLGESIRLAERIKGALNED